MGCDGGTIPKRDELVRTKKRPEQKDKNSVLKFKWGHCAISQQPLQRPIVGCHLGRLYNKEAVIKCILEGKAYPSTTPTLAKHIKNLKDVKDLVLCDNPAFKDSDTKGDRYNENLAVPFICPVIGLEMNGRFKFVFIWSCGCVFSERSLKAVGTKICHNCQQPFEESDVIMLNPNEAELEILRKNMAVRQLRVKTEKKFKKSGKPESALVCEFTLEPGVSCPIPEPANPAENGAAESESTIHLENACQPGTSQESSKPVNVAVKRPAPAPIFDNINVRKILKSQCSISKDPQASEVFKSIFTTHKNATDRTKAHWVTYNPFYN